MYGNIVAWNTAAVTSMTQMFHAMPTFNADIGRWNVARVANMDWMFVAAKAFNQDISVWNTASVSSMGRMFYLASAFNQNIASWNTASVTTMSEVIPNTSCLRAGMVALGRRHEHRAAHAARPASWRAKLRLIAQLVMRCHY
jgi:surface protein